MTLIIALVGLISGIIGYWYFTQVRYTIEKDKVYAKFLNRTIVISISTITEINEAEYYEGNMPTFELGLFKKMLPTYQFVVLTKDKRYKFSTRMTDRQLSQLKLCNPQIAIFVKPIEHYSKR